MTPHFYVYLTAPLIFGAALIAKPQASQPCCQVQPADSELTRGNPTARSSGEAPIVVLVFCDFESFACARSATVLRSFLSQTKQVRVIFKHTPAYSNPNAFLAHEAALAAEAQGKFWEMHDTLF